MCLLILCRWEKECKRRNLSSRSRVEPTYTLTSVLFFSSEQIIVVQEWLLESNILYLYPSNKYDHKIITFRLCLHSTNELHFHVLDSNIWTHRHQAVKAYKKKNKVLPLHYMRNVTCLHIVSHLHRSKIPIVPDLFIEAISVKYNTRSITQLVCKF